MDQSRRVCSPAVRVGPSRSLPTTVLPQFGGAQDTVFALPPGLDPGRRSTCASCASGPPRPTCTSSPRRWTQTLEEAAAHARMIAHRLRCAHGDGAVDAAGALRAHRPALSAVRHAVFACRRSTSPTSPARAFTGRCCRGHGRCPPTPGTCRSRSARAAAALFVREFANLRLFSPRVYRAFGWLALAFSGSPRRTCCGCSGSRSPVAAVGNLMFLGSAVFTLVVSFLAWRSGNRAAGWFLIAWALLCTFQILTAVRLLYAPRRRRRGTPLLRAGALDGGGGGADRARHLRPHARADRRAHRRRAARADRPADRRAEPPLARSSGWMRPACAPRRAGCRSRCCSSTSTTSSRSTTPTVMPQATPALPRIIPPIHAELRQSDVIGRYGGEEFVVILIGADAAAAHPIAERICRRVSEVRIEGFGAPIAPHLQHRRRRERHARRVGPAPDRARGHRAIYRQALGPQPGAARHLARGLGRPPPLQP